MPYSAKPKYKGKYNLNHIIFRTWPFKSTILFFPSITCLYPIYLTNIARHDAFWSLSEQRETHILDKQYVESIMNEWIIIINWFKTSEVVHCFISTALFRVAKRWQHLSCNINNWPLNYNNWQKKKKRKYGCNKM